MTTPDELLDVGYVRGAHGVQGSLSIQLHDPASEVIALRCDLIIAPRTGAKRACGIVSASETPGHAGRWRVQLEGVSSRDAADALRGSTLYVQRSALPALSDDEYYLADAIGHRVVREREGVQEPLGVVVGLTSNGAQDLLEVEWRDASDRPVRWLLPALPGFVLDVDDERVLVDVPLGMLPDELETP